MERKKVTRKTKNRNWEWSGIFSLVCWLLSAGIMGCSFMVGGVSHGIEERLVFSSDSIKQGITITEVTTKSALVWMRTEGPRELVITLWTVDQEGSSHLLQVFERETKQEKSFIVVLPVAGLIPNSSYEVRVSVKNPWEAALVRARFTTARPNHDVGPVRWVWSGDLGGQGLCRTPDRGYDIFDRMRETRPDFAILLGDLIYGDGPYPSPPNLPGSDFVATTPDEFRAKHRYQREDRAMQRFLASVPVYAQWDDHEVQNDFSGSTEGLTPAGLQGFQDYWPITIREETPDRLYRQIHRGANLDLFFLDTRRYRSPNTEMDGPNKTMLGKEQLLWLQNALIQSRATWKVIVSSVTLSIPNGEQRKPPAVDSWAQGRNGTGFAWERNEIVKTILSHHVPNVVWISTDVHFAQVIAYDPEGRGMPAFHELVCGPLSAVRVDPAAPEKSLNPTVLYSGGGFFNFGEVAVDHDSIEVRIVDELGTTKFQVSLAAQH